MLPHSDSVPILPLRLSYPDYDNNLDAADEAEFKAEALAAMEAPQGFCGSYGRRKKKNSKKIDLTDVPEIPLFEYPESISDLKENYKKQH